MDNLKAIAPILISAYAFFGSCGGDDAPPTTLGEQFVRRLHECGDFYLLMYSTPIWHMERVDDQTLVSYIDDVQGEVGKCVTRCDLDRDTCDELRASFSPGDFDCELECGMTLLTVSVEENCRGICERTVLVYNGWQLDTYLLPGEHVTNAVMPGEFVLSAESREGCKWDKTVTIDAPGFLWSLSCEGQSP